jgi:hypothetical protein
MSITFTPTWTDDAAGARIVIAPQALEKGYSIRGTLDLSTKFGAYLFLGLGRGGTTVLTNGVNVEVRRNVQAGSIRFPGAPWFSALSTTAAAIVKLINNTPGPYPVGTTALTLDGTGTPAADEDYCCWGVDAIPANATALPALEFVRASKFAANVLTIDAPCTVQKVDNEILTNKSDQWCVWCPGGAVYGVVFDYGDDSAGEAVAVVCYAQTLDSEQGA